ncbi:sodium:solute symporter family protein [Candidatus Uabimicrobium sp. HlEnr_7]|uniref:sodium:solute symporter family transporter n=1 Tax=Candidatus Uabimicrobium helgolandensis TaxID=3095367 RepID=UPI003557CBCD
MEIIPVIFKYFITLLYVGSTFFLSYIGMKKTKDLKGFSIGNKDMSPILVGITMAASISSTATFVINPGFVYNHGFSAYLHYAVAATLGIITALVTLSKGFRKLGAEHGSLTIPHWIRHRYGSKMLGLFFAVINLFSIAFIVLILSGCAILTSDLFGISETLALAIGLLFTFSYVLMGGTYAHAYTNSLQGILMILVAIILFFSGWEYWQNGFFSEMQNISDNFASMYNSVPFSKTTPLYYSFFSVFASGFLISFALMFQPHILTKVLYIKEEKDVNRFLVTTLIVGSIFTLMLFVGFYARFEGLEIGRQDRVVNDYIKHIYSSSIGGQCMLAFIAVTLLAAGMSTLDGILVSLSAMVVNDIYLPLTNKDDGEMSAFGLALSRYVLIAIGLVAFALAIKPPLLLGIFAQQGVYGLAAASFVPILMGVLLKRKIPTFIVWLAATIGVGGHLFLNLYWGVKNPSVSSSIAMLVSLGITLVLLAITYQSNKE